MTVNKNKSECQKKKEGVEEYGNELWLWEQSNECILSGGGSE